MASTSLGHHQESRSPWQRVQFHNTPQKTHTVSSPKIHLQHPQGSQMGPVFLASVLLSPDPQSRSDASPTEAMAELLLSTHILSTAPYPVYNTELLCCPEKHQGIPQSCSIPLLPASTHDCTLCKGMREACCKPEHHHVALPKVTDLFLLHIHILDVFQQDHHWGQKGLLMRSHPMLSPYASGHLRDILFA